MFKIEIENQGGDVIINGIKNPTTAQNFTTIPSGFGKFKIFKNVNDAITAQRLTKSGTVHYEVIINEGEAVELGPKYCTRTKKQYDEQNIYRHLIRRLNIPNSKLVFKDRKCRYSLASVINSFHKEPETTDYILRDSEDEYERCIEIRYSDSGRSDLIYQINKILITDNADVRMLKSMLAPLVYGKYANNDYIKACGPNGTFEMAREWVCSHYNLAQKNGLFYIKEKNIERIFFSWNCFNSPMQIDAYPFISVRYLAIKYGPEVLAPTTEFTE